MSDVGAHILVTGLVQGVGFRYFVHRAASSLGIRGYVQNLYNGDVEIRAVGDRGGIEEFIKQLKVGPRAAHVKALNIEWKDPDETMKGFEIR